MTTLSPFAIQLILALGSCPSCHNLRREENRPEDGIPDNCVYEAVFDCGAAVFVTTKDEYELGRACPKALDLALDALQERLTEEENADA